jgi:hypothetical protein
MDSTTLYLSPKLDKKDSIAVEIGDSKQPDFKPQFKVMRWDNEVNFSMRAAEDPTATVSVENGIVKYVATDYEVHQYEKNEVGEDGGFEFEWLLPSKPSSNVLTATISTKELAFFYQGELTASEKQAGDFRPDNVIGSYAVYHKSRAGNYLRGKNYKTGKAFHIYRPEAVDAKGNKTWCILNINERAGTLTVTVPQTFLNNAVYPVVVDPTFGYTSVGGTAESWVANDIVGYANAAGSSFTLTEPGSATGMSIYMNVSAGTTNAKALIYANGTPPGALKGTPSNALAISNTSAAWKDFTFSTPVVLNATAYALAYIVDAAITSYRDNTVGQATRYFSNGASYASPPDPFPVGATSGADRIGSFYVTYSTTPTTIAWLSA